MGAIIRLKKYSLALLSAAFLVACPLSAFASKGSMPHIHRIGVIPVQWNGVEFGYSPVQDMINAGFPEATRRSNRFRVLNDDLVASLWNTGDGRRELKEEFEIDGFLSLTLVPQGDVVVFELRLLSPDLSSYILETQRHKKLDLENATESQIDAHLEELLFRTFNRLPVDVTVTSVQGIYITLTGGKSQGLHNGDRINIVRPSINTVHPANGTWLSFTNQPMGTAEVLDAKNTTAVARISSQVYDNAIRIGDGAKINDIAGRAKFAQRGKEPDFRDSGSQQTVVVPPLFQDGSAAPDPNLAQVPTPGQTIPSGPTPAPGTSPAAPKQPTPGPGNTQPTPQQPVPAPNDPASGAPLDMAGPEKDGNMLEEVKLYIGAYQWSITGPVNTRGNFPVWLLNNAGLGIDQTLLHKIRMGFKGGGTFGGTKNGVFIGYEAEARIFWEDQIDIGDPTLNLWRGGGFASLQGMNVTDELYGGGDGLRGGGFAGVGGQVVVGDNFYRWYTELMVNPLHIGRIGYLDSQKNVESTFGWEYSIGAMRFQPNSKIDYGGTLVYGEERMTLQQGDRPRTTKFKILANVRYTFN